jgi:hypothetical protein
MTLTLTRQEWGRLTVTLVKSLGQGVDTIK